jgi:hypothetical protein
MADGTTGVRALDQVARQLVERARAEERGERPPRRRALRLYAPALAPVLAITAILGLALLALLVTGRERHVAVAPVTSVPGPAPRLSELVPPAQSVDPRLVANFAVFRRPQRPGDVPGSGQGVLSIESRPGLVAGGINKRLSRRVGAVASDARIFVTPGRGWVCVSMAGCADIASAVRGKGPVGTAQCGVVTRSSAVRIVALVPDHAQRVRIRRRDGTEVPVLVTDNALVTVMSTRPALVAPTTIVWDGPQGHDATTLGGIDTGIRCGPPPPRAK